MEAVGGVVATLRLEDNPDTLPMPRLTQSEERRIKRKAERHGAESLTAFENGTAATFQLPNKRFVQTVRLAGPCAISRAVYRDHGTVLKWPQDRCSPIEPSRFARVLRV